MDEQRFDNLTRLLGSGRDRRTVLRGLLGGAGALAGLSALRPEGIGAQQCRTPGEVCQNNPGQGNECCAGLTCDDIDPTTGNGHCGDCPSGQTFCDDTGTCSACCTECCANSDCGACQACDGGTCIDLACCDDSDCGPCQECEGNQCVDLACCADSDCDPCFACQNHQCVSTDSEYCPDGDYCYSPMTGGCCSGDECGCGECVNRQCTVPQCCSDDDCNEGARCIDGQCAIEVCFERIDCENVQQPSCPDLCPDGSFPGNNRALDGVCCTGNGTCCSNNCVDGVCVGGPPPPQCETDADCGACAFCDSGTCLGECSQSQECCIAGDTSYCAECCDNSDCGACEICDSGICAPVTDCCKDFGEYCGLEVAAAGGDTSQQLDCCDGLLCCENWNSQGSVCAQCCTDWDCGKGGVCNEGVCEYPVVCHHDWQCPEHTCCCHDGSCSWHCCDHHHPHPHPKPPKPAPTPAAPVTSLPATGAGKGQSDSSAVGITLAAGAAALLGAKILRQANEAAEASDDV